MLYFSYLLRFYAQGGKGYARNITFEHITSIGSARPIIIDQYYCDHKVHKHCGNHVTLLLFFSIQ